MGQGCAATRVQAAVFAFCDAVDPLVDDTGKFTMLAKSGDPNVRALAVKQVESRKGQAADAYREVASMNKHGKLGA
jgi:hypothetical protein